MDWLLAQMRLVDVEDEEEEAEQDMMSEKDGQVFFKIIQSYADCKLVIDNYKTGVVCIYSLASMESSEAREMMNYISGGVYALDGDINTVGENVFMTRPSLQVCSR